MASNPAFVMEGELQKLKSDFAFARSFFNNRYFAIVRTTFKGKQEYALQYYANKGHAKEIVPCKGKILLRNINKICRPSASEEFFKGLKAPRLKKDKTLGVMTTPRNKQLGFEIWGDIRNYFLVANDPESLAYWVVGLSSVCGLQQHSNLQFPKRKGAVPTPPKYIVKLRGPIPSASKSDSRDRDRDRDRNSRRRYSSSSDDDGDYGRRGGGRRSGGRSGRSNREPRDLGFGTDKKQKKQRRKDEAAARTRGSNWQPPGAAGIGSNKRFTDKPKQSKQPKSGNGSRHARSRSPSPDRRRRRRRDKHKKSRSPSPDRRRRRDKSPSPDRRRRRREKPKKSPSPSPDRRRGKTKKSRSPSPDRRRGRSRRQNHGDAADAEADSGRRNAGRTNKDEGGARRRRGGGSAGRRGNGASRKRDPRPRSESPMTASDSSSDGEGRRRAAKSKDKRPSPQRRAILSNNKTPKPLAGTQTAYDIAAESYEPQNSGSESDKDDLDETVLHEEDDDIVFTRRRQASMDEKRMAREKAAADQKTKILNLSNLADDDDAPLELSSDEETSPIVAERKSFVSKPRGAASKPASRSKHRMISLSSDEDDREIESSRHKPASRRAEARVNSEESSEEDVPVSRKNRRGGADRRKRRDARRAKRAGKSGLDARVAKKTSGITPDDDFDDDWDD